MTTERRYESDRRSRPTPLISRHMFWGGRRKAARRNGDFRCIYVDQLEPGLFSVLLLIFFFHCLDALFTLLHLGRGGVELNPIMDYYLRKGPGVFLVVKLGLAGIGLVFLGLHKNFPFVRAGIAALFVIFAGLVGYHCLLIIHS